MHRILAILFAATLSASAVDVDLGRITDLYAVPVSAGQATFTVASGGGGGPTEFTVVTNMLALYHLNNNTYDEVSTSSGTTSGVPAYVAGDRLGSHDVYISSGNYITTVNNALIVGQSELTLMLWLKFALFRSNGGVLLCRGSDNAHSIGLMQRTGDKVCAGIADRYGTISGALATNQWYHIAATYSNNAGTVAVRLYLDGALISSGSEAGMLSPFAADDYFRIGFDDEAYQGPRITTGWFDEAAVFNRVLPSNEVYAIYQSQKESP